VTPSGLQVFLFEKRDWARKAIDSLDVVGADLSQVSLMGRGRCGARSDRRYSVAANSGHVAYTEPFWKNLGNRLSSPTMSIPHGREWISLAGPVVGTLVAVLDGAAALDDITACAATLMGLGVQRDRALECARRLKRGDTLLAMHGHGEDASLGREILHGLAKSPRRMAFHVTVENSGAGQVMA